MAAAFDVIIIGAGPGGMTAGVYTSRKQLKTLVISENIGGQTLLSSSVENYLGYNYISGIELARKFEQHLEEFDVEIKYELVDSIKIGDKVFTVKSDNAEYTANVVIIASGKSPRKLGVPGEDAFRGRGVTYCGTCDAPLFRGKNVAVIGGGNSGLDAVIQLTKLSPKVYLVERGPKLRADQVYQRQAKSAGNVEILTSSEVVAIEGSLFVDSLSVKNRKTKETKQLPVQGVLIEIGLNPNVKFLPPQVELNRYNEIQVDTRCRTNVEGLFAAGDVTNVQEKQIVIAAGEGAKAALAAYEYLVRRNLISPGDVKGVY